MEGLIFGVLRYRKFIIYLFQQQQNASKLGVNALLKQLSQIDFSQTQELT